MDRSLPLAACVLCLLVSLAALPAFVAGVPASSSGDSGVRDVSLSGPAVIDVTNPATHDTEVPGVSGESQTASLWQSDSFSARLVIAPFTGVSTYRICAYAHANGTSSRLGCERTTTADRSTGDVNLSGLAWPANTSGSARLSFLVYNASAGPDATPLDNTTLTTTVLTKDGDADGDGLTSRDELELRLNPLDADMDRDGLTDGTEVNDYSTSPKAADTDHDGVRDGEEVQAGSDPTIADTDNDGIDDETELTVGTDPSGPRTTERLGTGALAIVYFALGSIVVRRRDDDDPEPEPPANAPMPDAALVADADAEVEVAGNADNGIEDAPTFLTDGDRVKHLLDRYGGRMKQSAIVEETGWSKAKVSRLLSTMDENGEIEKLSLGRENVISLDREWIDTAEGGDSKRPIADGGSRPGKH